MYVVPFIFQMLNACCACNFLSSITAYLKYLWHYAVGLLVNRENKSYNQGISDKFVYIIHILHCTQKRKFLTRQTIRQGEINFLGHLHTVA